MSLHLKKHKSLASLILTLLAKSLRRHTDPENLEYKNSAVNELDIKMSSQLVLGFRTLRVKRAFPNVCASVHLSVCSSYGND